MKIVVRVHGEPHEVTVDQLSKSVWRATGEYMNERHQTKDRSATTAAARWREWAEYKGN